jgi:hypothetical protein
VVLAAVVVVVVVVVSVGQPAVEADFGTVVTVPAVVTFAAEVEKREVEWNEPTSQSAKYKPNA